MEELEKSKKSIDINKEDSLGESSSFQINSEE